jgi:tetratricopeptide (TPR) repeat protein
MRESGGPGLELFSSKYEFNIKEKRMRKVSFFVLIVMLFHVPVFAAVDDLGNLNRRLAAAKSTIQQATVQKEIGDYYANSYQYEKASEYYLKALPVLRNRLPEDQLTQIAVYISWGGKLPEATSELRSLLKRFPKNAKARTHLAKVLLWSGNLDGALAEAETVLAAQADDRDALYVKAEVLRNKGELDRSIAIYKGVLAHGEDFDTQLGLAYAYFQKGDLELAKRTASVLKPVYPYQTQELKNFALQIDTAIASSKVASGDVGDFNRRLAAAKDKVEEATIQKELGDFYFDGDQYQKAAESYLKALPVLRDRLPEDQLTQMVVSIAWGGKLQEATSELRALLKRYPKNTKARTQLARVLLWSGNQDGALAEAESVLASQADEREALFVKAEVLRNKGELDRSIAIYKGILARGDDFDTQLGLANAYFQKGDLETAKRTVSALKPVYPYQTNELKNVTLQIDTAMASRKAAVGAVGAKADQLKSEGDQFADDEKYPAAAEKYVKALEISHAFPMADRVHMATVMAWAGMYEGARRELEDILAKDPANKEARVQLTQVLLWSGESDAAIRQADMVLATDSENREARLTKANALRAKGFFRKADQYYKALLAKSDDFDVRSGQTYSFLASGNHTATDESLARLKPRNASEEKELSDLRGARDWEMRPRLYTGAMFYYDSDDNRVALYNAGTQFWLGNWRANVDYFHTRAQSEILAYDENGVATSLNGGARNDTVQLSSYARMPWYGGIGGGVGLSDGRFFTWNAKADIDVLYGSIGVYVANETVTDLAQVIENNIRAMTYSAFLNQRPTDRITVTGSYTYREYSDSNGSHDLQASIAYLFWRRPSIAVGYQFRSLDFRRQSGGGYFDPDDLKAHSVFLNFAFDASPFYGNITPSIGYQDFSRNDEHQSGIFGNITGLLGYRLGNRMAIEATAGWGNSLAGASGGAGSGWYYYVAGLRVILVF